MKNSKEKYIINSSSKEAIILDFSKDDFSYVEISKNVSVELVFSSLPEDLKVEIKEGANVHLKMLLKNDIKNSRVYFILNKDARVVTHAADFSNGNADVFFDFELKGEGSYSEWRMASVSSSNDKKNFNISIEHIGEHTVGFVDNYGVCKDHSVLKFLGTSKIDKGSHKAETRQNARIMVFDKESDGVCKPILKIDENDIKASHGASLGKVNEEHMFYLMSRGLTEKEAKRLIILGYLNPILSGFGEGKMKEEMTSLIGGKI